MDSGVVVQQAGIGGNSNNFNYQSEILFYYGYINNNEVSHSEMDYCVYSF